MSEPIPKAIDQAGVYDAVKMLLVITVGQMAVASPQALLLTIMDKGTDNFRSR